jgi:transposase-like protein
MSPLQVVDDLRSKERPAPPCARCGARLWLTRIEPRLPGFDCRSFECSKCHSTFNYEVEYGTASEWVRIED